MKQRIVTACIGLVVFFTILFWYNTIVFDIAICIVSIIAVHELLLATKCTKNIPLTINAMVMSIVPFLFTKFPEGNYKEIYSNLIPILCFVFIAIMFLIFLRYHETLEFKNIATAFYISLVVPFTLTTLIYIRNNYNMYQALYFTLLIFACSWGADSGAYFAGRFFGKRKLAPKISPNKTIEGVYGGVLSAILFVSIVTAVYYFYMQSIGQVVSINYWGLLIISVVGSLVGVLGDLCASTIKRQCNIKDFGSIMPGHGGILDRFDSVLFVAPFMFVILKIISL